MDLKTGGHRLHDYATILSIPRVPRGVDKSSPRVSLKGVSGLLSELTLMVALGMHVTARQREL